jgi:hypothetical protein
MEEIIRKQKAVIEKLKRQVDSKGVFNELPVNDKKQRNSYWRIE